jgi:hypothetical protein
MGAPHYRILPFFDLEAAPDLKGLTFPGSGNDCFIIRRHSVCAHFCGEREMNPEKSAMNYPTNFARVLTLLAIGFFLTGSGCSTIMHELQPHRLWRLNYQEPTGRTDGVYFSMDDPLTASNAVDTPSDERALADASEN